MSPYPTAAASVERDGALCPAPLCEGRVRRYPSLHPEINGQCDACARLFRVTPPPVQLARRIADQLRAAAELLEQAPLSGGDVDRVLRQLEGEARLLALVAGALKRAGGER